MKMKIYSAMSAVMADAEPIAKDRQNKGQGYAFRGIDDVYEALQAVLVKHKVFTLPTVLEQTREERTSKSGGLNIYSILKIKYTFYTDDGSNVEAVVIGEGMDSGDKASNKGMSVAHKYALLQAFAIPTKDPKDPENDSHELSDRQTYASRPASQPQYAVNETKPAGKPGAITEKQRARLWGIAKEVQIPEATLREIVAAYGYESTSDIGWKDYEKIVNEVTNWNKG